MAFSKKTRQEYIEKLKNEELDLLIIGGGITGAGVAIQAAASGIKTGLLEMQDFSEGTSSRSTKLIHGGIRYLKTFDVEVVSDTVTERSVVHHIAPHIPKPDRMLLPIYEGEGVSSFNMFTVKVAMDLYDHLAKIEDNHEKNYLLTKEQVLERQPFIKEEGLLGAGVYMDFRNNDARLVIDNIKKAAQDGAYLVNRAKVIGFLYEESQQVKGVKARDELSGEVFEVRAKLVINTSGPWVDKVRHLNFTRAVAPKLRPTKGVHLVVDAAKLPVPQPTYFDTGKNDGRMVFTIPRENKTYFGTTDTDYQGDFKNPQVTKEDVDYLLEVINHRYPKANLSVHDIESSWAGLRPLLIGNSGSDYNGGDNGTISDKSFNDVIHAVSAYKEKKIDKAGVEKVLGNLETARAEKTPSPSSISRGSNLEVEPDGLLTLSGGKITDYRMMAEGALDLVLELLQKKYERTFQKINSKTYAISGGEFDVEQVDIIVAEHTKIGVAAGLTAEEAQYIADFYGNNSLKIFELAKNIHAFDGLTLAESARLLYAMEDEMTLTPADYLVRRTNHLLFMRDTLDAIKLPVLDAMAKVLEWTKEEKAEHLAKLETVIAESDLLEIKQA